jgi:protein phosphatase
VFPRELGQRLGALDMAVDLRAELEESFLATDAALSEHEYVGTTSTVCLMWEFEGRRYLQTADVGDSTAVLLRKEGPVVLSVDHKPKDASEKARIRAMGVEISDAATRVSGMAVSRAWGDHFMKQQQTGLVGDPFVSEPIELTHDDSLLIVASDGLWDVVSFARATEIASRFYGDPARSARELGKLAIANPKNHDHTTVCVVEL